MKMIQYVLAVSIICFATNYASAEDVHLHRKDIIITGEVKQPKAFSVSGNEEANLLDLLSSCDGFTDEADVKRILIIQNGKLTTVNLTVLRGILVNDEHRVPQLMLNSGSVVVVAARAAESE